MTPSQDTISDDANHAAGNRASGSRTVVPPPSGRPVPLATGHGQAEPSLDTIQREPVDLEIIIPARNEAHRITRTLTEAISYLATQTLSSRIVVVNNGSADRTTEVVDGLAGEGVPVVVIGCSAQGKGAAVRRGMLTSAASFVGFCDADLATPIETLDTVVPLLRDGVDVVVASRRVPGSRVAIRQPLLRRLGGWAFRRSARALVPDVQDTQCGFKFFSAAAARQLFAQARVDDFAFDVEILALAAELGLTVFEVPIAWSDQDDSSFSSVQDGLGSFRSVLRMGRGREAR